MVIGDFTHYQADRWDQEVQHHSSVELNISFCPTSRDVQYLCPMRSLLWAW